MLRRDSQVRRKGEATLSRRGHLPEKSVLRAARLQTRLISGVDVENKNESGSGHMTKSSPNAAMPRPTVVLAMVPALTERLLTTDWFGRLQALCDVPAASNGGRSNFRASATIRNSLASSAPRTSAGA